MTEPLVALEDAAIGYGGRALLSGLGVAIHAGDFLAVVGPNGGGKTTLLRTLLGAQPLVGGPASSGARPLRVGYVPQREHVDAIWPFTVGEVALMGRVPALGPLRSPRAADHEVVRRALARVGIDHLAARWYGELSGGQRQRTLIARALAAEPELLALDEPTNGMDPGAELATMDLLRALQQDGPLAIVMVSHRIEAARELRAHVRLRRSGGRALPDRAGSTRCSGRRRSRRCTGARSRCASRTAAATCTRRGGEGKR